MSDYERYFREAASIASQTEQEKADFSLIALIGLAPTRDGDMWCFIWGEDLQTGVAGFGPTIRSAAQNFMLNIYREPALAAFDKGGKDE